MYWYDSLAIPVDSEGHCMYILIKLGLCSLVSNIPRLHSDVSEYLDD